ncbi:hypothetical protein [Hymenobacter qilianensis]|uniref:hypothetical protein n=1 Tax=Hymenobacter qilianensis TaxID=1385715 RepID=UPI00293C0013|nr:hypothetical protein [Hymenobacter qilianensis]
MIRLLRPLFLLLPLLGGFSSCQNAPQQQAADLVVYNATVYTVDSAFSKAQAFAVQDGKFLAVGTADEIRQKYKGKQEVDAGGNLSTLASMMRTATSTATPWACASLIW